MGINNIHSNSIIPIRTSKKHKLTDDEKWYNNEISKVRIAIEHVNAFIKKFKITSTRYRNRRKNFKLYMSLICGIYNFETANLQFTDRPINLMMSHINSYKRKKLNNSSALEMFNLMYGNDIANKLNILEINSNDINLTPSLLKRN